MFNILLINMCNKRRLCSNLNCQQCYQKSFASHPRAIYWSIENKEDPRNVFKNSSKKFKFNCNICSHQFESTIKNIFRKNIWCPYCCNPPIKLCSYEDCQHCYKNSFASHPKAIYWSKMNNKKPREVFKFTHVKYIFDCDICSHQFIKSLDSICGKKTWCLYCCNQKLCQNEDCEICFNKSFASHPKVIYWSDTNTKNPRNVFKGSSKKFKFDCNICQYQFESILKWITNKNGTWCPKCKNKTELKLLNHLKEIYPNTIHQYKTKWCKNLQTNRYLLFDFCIEKLKIIIEIDGPQHFTQVSNWQSHDEIRERDIYKMKCALQNGYTIIRMLQEDIWKNRINWICELEKYLRIYEKAEIITISEGAEYDYHLDELN